MKFQFLAQAAPYLRIETSYKIITFEFAWVSIYEICTKLAKKEKNSENSEKTPYLPNMET